MSSSPQPAAPAPQPPTRASRSDALQSGEWHSAECGTAESRADPSCPDALRPDQPSLVQPSPEQPRPALPRPELTILYDGGCPLCLREVAFLRRRDRRHNGPAGRLAFVDIDAAGYDPDAHAGIGYQQAMGRIHALAADGTVLRDLAVFRRAYALIGLGWLYAPTRWPLLGPVADGAYGLWARWRLQLTGRPSLGALCQARAALAQGASRSGRSCADGGGPGNAADS